jgi:hypothetical protein
MLRIAASTTLPILNAQRADLFRSGHEVGKAVLKRLAMFIRRMLRKSVHQGVSNSRPLCILVSQIPASNNLPDVRNLRRSSGSLQECRFADIALDLLSGFILQ